LRTSDDLQLRRRIKGGQIKTIEIPSGMMPAEDLDSIRSRASIGLCKMPTDQAVSNASSIKEMSVDTAPVDRLVQKEVKKNFW
jgi:hypothetical protein